MIMSNPSALDRSFKCCISLIKLTQNSMFYSRHLFLKCVYVNICNSKKIVCCMCTIHFLLCILSLEGLSIYGSPHLSILFKFLNSITLILCPSSAEHLHKPWQVVLHLFFFCFFSFLISLNAFSVNSHLFTIIFPAQFQKLFLLLSKCVHFNLNYFISSR